MASGGHDVPAPDVRRRVQRSISNFFKLYKPLLDSWMFFDNSKSTYRLIAEEKDGKLKASDTELFVRISKGVVE